MRLNRRKEGGGQTTNYQSDHQTGNKEARQSFIMETMEKKKVCWAKPQPPSPFSSSDLEEASNPKVTPRRSVHILGPADGWAKAGSQGV